MISRSVNSARATQHARFSRGGETATRDNAAEESQPSGPAEARPRTHPPLSTHLHGPARAHSALCELSQVNVQVRITPTGE